MSICSRRGALVAIALAGATGTARAHDVACEQTINGQTAFVVSHYPATLHFGVTITNIHPTDASTVAAIRAPFLEGLGFRFTPAAPFTLPLGGSAAKGFDVHVGSKKACEALAAGMSAMPSYGTPAYGVAMARLTTSTRDAYGKPCDCAPGGGKGDGHGGKGGDDHGKGDDGHHGEDGHHGDDGHHGEDGHDGDDDHGHGGMPPPVNACTSGSFVDSIFVASFDSGAAECRARIVCGEEMGGGDGHGGDGHGEDGHGHHGEGGHCEGHGGDDGHGGGHGGDDGHGDGHGGGDDHHGEGGSYGAPAKSGW